MDGHETYPGTRPCRIESPTGFPDDPARYWWTDGFDVIAEPRLRRFLDYWRSKCVDERWPTRSAIDPVEIPWALSRIYLVDRVPPPTTWRYRLGGAAIEETFEVLTLRGVALVDLMSDERARLVTQRWQLMIDRGCAIYMRGLIYQTTERLPVGARLLLPLGDGSSSEVAGLIGLTDSEWQSSHAGDAETPGLDVHYIPAGGC